MTDEAKKAVIDELNKMAYFFYSCSKLGKEVTFAPNVVGNYIVETIKEIERLNAAPVEPEVVE